MNQNPISICLWFDYQAEEAVRLYTSVFKDSETGRISRYGKEGFEIHGRQDGSVMTIEFRLNQLHFIALNGGPQFTFNESASIVVNCDTQAEIDHYWAVLTQGGGTEGPCGWLKDRFGVSWQIVPSVLRDMIIDPDQKKQQRVTQAYLQMKKFNIEALQSAFRGNI